MGPRTRAASKKATAASTAGSSGTVNMKMTSGKTNPTSSTYTHKRQRTHQSTEIPHPTVSLTEEGLAEIRNVMNDVLADPVSQTLVGIDGYMNSARDGLDELMKETGFNIITHTNRYLEEAINHMDRHHEQAIDHIDEMLTARFRKIQRILESPFKDVGQKMESKDHPGESSDRDRSEASQEDRSVYWEGGRPRLRPEWVAQRFAAEEEAERQAERQKWRG